MPRFFFNVFDDATTIDEVGQDLPDVAAAHEAALEEARAILADEVRSGRIDLSHRIEVEDEERRPVLLLPFSAAVEIEGPVNKGGPNDSLA
jgi:hypothetical protein